MSDQFGQENFERTAARSPPATFESPCLCRAYVARAGMSYAIYRLEKLFRISVGESERPPSVGLRRGKGGVPVSWRGVAARPRTSALAQTPHVLVRRLGARYARGSVACVRVGVVQKCIY